MTQNRYGVKYQDGNYTGGITTEHGLAIRYARLHKGAHAYKVGSSDDPEVAATTQQRKLE